MEFQWDVGHKKSASFLPRRISCTNDCINREERKKTCPILAGTGFQSQTTRQYVAAGPACRQAANFTEKEEIFPIDSYWAWNSNGTWDIRNPPHSCRGGFRAQTIASIGKKGRKPVPFLPGQVFSRKPHGSMWQQAQPAVKLPILLKKKKYFRLFHIGCEIWSLSPLSLRPNWI